jgi:hypothetical protein
LRAARRRVEKRSSRAPSRSTIGVSHGVFIGPSFTRAVESSRKVSGAPSKPAT